MRCWRCQNRKTISRTAIPCFHGSPSMDICTYRLGEPGLRTTTAAKRLVFGPRCLPLMPRSRLRAERPATY
jgi:hypothetical protein